MKNSVKILCVLLVVSALLMGCASNGAEDGKKTVTIWSYGSDNVKTTFEKLANAFNKSEHGKKYQMKVEFISSGSNAQSLLDRTIAAKKAGKKNTDYDLIEVSDAELAAYQSEGGDDFFQKLDTSKMPNAKNVKAKLSTGQDILMPYRGTTVVLAYDSAKVSNPPKTADELYQWIKDHKGKFAYNSPSTGGAGGSFVTTSVYNQLPEEALVSSDEKWSKEWTPGFKLLKALHPYFYQSGGKTVYPNKNQGTLDLLANQQIEMTPAWVDQVVNEINSGILPKSIKMVQMDPAFTGNLASLAIPKIGGNKDGAYAVMDFMISKEAQTILLDEMGAFPVIDSSDIKSDNTKMISKFDVSTFRTSSIGVLGQELLKKWDEEIATLK
ncbi:extracellular solute-binding protein [Sporolactobacillus inulinus]|uniref:ABC transporter substrate-binding protein n=1 Tax=Sporolactobacillus inulinus CASD TaxID=1069536 RepID=A0A0U1QQ56_9BACL|nr:extracellular solute-binding protein [Sporolactobacillus inulinus]KLI02947.1 ABC transporter substrate-binding protein [Sporolactobacillus inulinus CASD]GEB76596.1 ABC transporter substrate-binding protein [Sporolactobacillus inulinus]